MSSLELFLIQPTRYDDDGYPLQWVWSLVPSNSLACVAGLVRDAIDRGVLKDFGDVKRDASSTRSTPRSTCARIVAAREAARSSGFPGRRAVQSISARDGHRAPAARGGHSGLHRRLPCLGMPFDAEDAAARSRRGARPRGQLLRRRGRGRPDRRGAARRLRRRAEAGLQSPRQYPESGGRAVPAARQGTWSPRTSAGCRASISAAAARSSVRSAPSSMCRAARAAFARPTIWKRIVRANAELGI